MLTMHQMNRVEALIVEISARLTDSIRGGYGETHVDVEVIELVSGESGAVADEVFARLAG